MAGKKQIHSVDSKSLSLIYGKGRGWCFSANDFGHLGSRSSIDNALHRLEKKGTIRRVYRGLYDYPRHSKLLNQVMGPDMDQVAKALARKFNWYIQPTSQTAQSLIGLSTQIVARFEYMSNGPTRSFSILEGNEILFKSSNLKDSGFKLNESAMLVQAIKGFESKEGLGEKDFEQLKSWLPDDLKKRVLKDTKMVTGWVHDIIFRLCTEEG